MAASVAHDAPSSGGGRLSTNGRLMRMLCWYWGRGRWGLNNGDCRRDINVNNWGPDRDLTIIDRRLGRGGIACRRYHATW